LPLRPEPKKLGQLQMVIEDSISQERHFRFRKLGTCLPCWKARKQQQQRQAAVRRAAMENVEEMLGGAQNCIYPLEEKQGLSFQSFSSSWDTPPRYEKRILP
jgi:hypothetical protein